LGLSQVGGAGFLNQEDLNQITENLSGTKAILAKTAGITPGELKKITATGSAKTEDYIPRFISRLAAENDLVNNDTDIKKIQQVQNKLQELEEKFGTTLLGGGGASSSALIGTIDLITNNLDILIKTGVAGLTLLAAQTILASDAFKKLSTSVNANGLKAGAGVIGGMVAPLAQSAALAVGLTLIFEAGVKITDAFTGGNTPGRAIVEDIKIATAAIDKLNASSGQIVDTAAAIKAKYQGNKTFSDNFEDFKDAPFNFIFDNTIRNGSDSSKFTKGLTQSERYYLQQDRARTRQATEAGDKFIAGNTQAISSFDDQKLAEINDKIRLNSIAGSNRNLSIAEKNQIARDKDELIRLKTAEEAKIQIVAAGADKIKKTYESLLNDVTITNDPAQIEYVKKLREQLAQVTKISEDAASKMSQASKATLAVTNSIEAMNVNLSRAKTIIDQRSLNDETNTLIKLKGNLDAGLAVTLEYARTSASILGKLGATIKANESTQAILNRGNVKTEIDVLKASNRLPANIRDITDEELTALKADKSISQNTIKVIEANRNQINEIERYNNEYAQLSFKRAQALKEEAKASARYLVERIADLEKNRLASDEAMRALRAQELGVKYKSSITGFNSAINTFVSESIDIFTQLSELSKIENDRRKSNYELQLQRLKSTQGYQDREQNRLKSETEAKRYQGEGGDNYENSGLIFVSPMAGKTSSQLRKYRPEPMQQPFARRSRIRNGKKVSEEHGAVDFDSDIGGGVGDKIVSPVAGVATVTDVGAAYGDGRASVDIKFKDPITGKNVMIRNMHLSPSSVKSATGVGMSSGVSFPVTAGQYIGNVGALDAGMKARTPGLKDHLHFSVKINGQTLKDPLEYLIKMVEFGEKNAKPGAPRAIGGPMGYSVDAPETPAQMQERSRQGGGVGASGPQRQLPRGVSPSADNRTPISKRTKYKYQPAEIPASIPAPPPPPTPTPTVSDDESELKRATDREQRYNQMLIDAGRASNTWSGSKDAPSPIIKDAATFEVPIVVPPAPSAPLKAKIQAIKKKKTNQSVPKSVPGGRADIKSVEALVLNTIAYYETNNPTNITSYYERQNKGLFDPNKVDATGWPLGVRKKENIGRYQVNRGDYLDARRKNPRDIKDFSPASQDKIALFRMGYDGLKGRDKGRKSLQTFINNPTMENFVKFRTDLGAEWEGLRDGKTRYPGTDRNKDFMTRKGKNDPELYREFLKILGKTVSDSSITNDDIQAVLIAAASVGIVSDTPTMKLIASKVTDKSKKAKKATIERAQKTIKWGGNAAPFTGTASPVSPASTIKNQMVNGKVIVKPVPQNYTNPDVVTVGGLAGSLLDSLLPGVQYNNTIPVPTGDPEIDNRTVYEAEIANADRELKDNDTRANVLTSIKIVEIKTKRRIAEANYRKNRQAEKVAELNRNRSLIDKTKTLGYSSPEDELADKLTTIDREKFDTAKQGEFDKAELKKEIQSYQQLLNDIKATDKTGLSPMQVEELDRLMDELPDAIKITNDRYKSLNNYLYGVNKYYDKSIKDLKDKFAADEKMRISASKVSTSQSTIEVLNKQLEAAKAWQERQPNDYITKGDPLKIQAQIDRLQAQNTYSTTIDSINRDKRGLNDANPAEAKILKDLNTKATNAEQVKKKTLDNIDNALFYAINERANTIATAVKEKRIELTNKQQEVLESALATRVEKQRLNPQFEDVDVIAKAAIDAEREKTRYQQVQVELTTRAQKDLSATGRAQIIELRAAELAKHKAAMDNIAIALGNNLTEAELNRRNKKLIEDKAIIESSLSVAGAKAGYLGASGYGYKSKILSDSITARQEGIGLSEKLEAIERDLRTGKLNETDYVQLRNDAIDYYEYIAKARQTALTKSVNDNRFNLDQSDRQAGVDTIRGVAGGLAARGNSYDARDLNRSAALAEQDLSYRSRLKELKELRTANEGDAAAVKSVDNLIRNLETLNKIKLDAINKEFSKFGAIVDDTVAASGNIIGKMLSGQGTESNDWSQLIAAPFKAITNELQKYLTSVLSELINEMLSGVVGQLNDVMGDAGSARGGADNAKSSIIGQILSYGVKWATNSLGGGLGDPNSLDIPGYAVGGVINPNLPISATDNRLILARDGEGILVPGAVKALGGKMGIDAINSMYAGAFASGGVVDSSRLGQIQSSGMRNSSLTSSTISRSSSTNRIAIDYVKIGDRDYVDRDHLDEMMMRRDAKLMRSVAEYNRDSNDRQFHSYQQRQIDRY
jgi:tape measure domain-containing protein